MRTAPHSMPLHIVHISHYSNLRRLIITERLNVIYYTYHIYTKWHCLFKLCWSLHFQRSAPSLAKFNLTENSEEGTAEHMHHPRITPASKSSKLIYPINEEWGLMLMRDDNSTGQLFFIALLLQLWINHKRQSDKYCISMTWGLSSTLSLSFCNTATPLPLKDDRTWYGSLRK